MTQTAKTFRERCRIAEQCLPVAGYRTLLEKLHAEMLAALDVRSATSAPTTEQVEAALRAACMRSTPESRKDMGKALRAANALNQAQTPEQTARLRDDIEHGQGYYLASEADAEVSSDKPLRSLPWGAVREAIRKAHHASWSHRGRMATDEELISAGIAEFCRLNAERLTPTSESQPTDGAPPSNTSPATFSAGASLYKGQEVFSVVATDQPGKIVAMTGLVGAEDAGESIHNARRLAWLLNQYGLHDQLQADSALERLLDRHDEQLLSNPFCCFELTYTKRAGWVASLSSNDREEGRGPIRKFLGVGHGVTPQEACADALVAGVDCLGMANKPTAKS